MEEKAYFSTENMTVGYDGKPLIREIEMRVRRGEILTLIGPNGGGKSTILKSITRQLKTIGGIVWIDGRRLNDMSGRELSQKLAVVLTERIHPELMTCEDVVAAGRYPYTGTLGILSEEDRRRIREAMERVHALELCERDFNAISDGQRQRVLLARAICQEPELIVLDEPTSYLDIRHKLELLTILRGMVAEKQVAVIVSLHELDLAQKISDFVLCVRGERIDRAGTPEEVFTSDYIRSLYGITTGSYDARFGCVELEAVKGSPEIFVIGGGGTGIPVYRALQRKEIPFAAGILHQNDIDYETARLLASEVIAEAPFEPISRSRFEAGVAAMQGCREVVCTLSSFGTMNEANRRLRDIAGQKGMLRSQNDIGLPYYTRE